MPVVRVDVPEGHPREKLMRIKRRVEDSLLVREFPERAFVVDGGKRLPPLERITPHLS
jgi:hypothetical protein